MILLLACASGPEDLSATLSEVIPTVATVRWTTAEPTVGAVRYGDQVTPTETEPATEHSAELLGLVPNEETTWTVVLDDGTESEPQALTAGALSGDLPTLTTTGTNDQWIVTSLLGSVNGPAILDPEGRIVWFYPDASGLDTYRARLSRDQKSVIYNAASVSGDPAEDSRLVRVSLDGTQVEETSIPLLAHDFVELEDGSVVAMVVEYGEDELRGDQLVQITPDGTQSQVWSAYDCFDPVTEPGLDPEHGWTFANALDHDEATGDFLLSLRNFSSLVRIDPETRTCPWVFGSTAATVQPSGEIFRYEHQFSVTDDEILVFDNEGAGGSTSRVIGYGNSGAATEAAQWTYTSDPEIHTFVLGDVERLDDGGLMVDWAVGGGFDRADAQGNTTWTLRSGIGGAFGFATVQGTVWE